MAASTHGDGTKGAFGHDYAALVDVLAPLRGTRPVYVPNPGNAGDSLISANACQFFEDMGLEVETGYYRFDYPGRHRRCCTNRVEG